jgi:hypothetical protein
LKPVNKACPKVSFILNGAYDIVKRNDISAAVITGGDI